MERIDITKPQIRILRVLSAAKGPISRSTIQERIGNKSSAYVAHSVGQSDPAKRKEFEAKHMGGRPSLLTLGLVTERQIDVDGVKEVVLQLTELGRKACEGIKHIEIDPLGQDE